MTDTIEKKPKAPALNFAHCKQADFERTVHAVCPPYGIEFATLLEPSYWAHVAAMFKPRDRIEVYPEDGSYYAELFVVAAGRQWAKVVELRKVDLNAGAAIPVPAAEFVVNWGGPSHKHRVIRKSDNTVLKSGFSTPEEANAWLADYQKALAA